VPEVKRSDGMREANEHVNASEIQKVKGDRAKNCGAEGTRAWNAKDIKQGKE